MFTDLRLFPEIKYMRFGLKKTADIIGCHSSKSVRIRCIRSIRDLFVSCEYEFQRIILLEIEVVWNLHFRSPLGPLKN